MGLDKKTAKRDLRKFELEEFTSPSPRKIDGSRVIYESRPLVPRIYKYGRPVFCDFGQARFGNYDNLFDIQPYQYRAPEVIFDIPWDEKVDIWSVGVMVRAAMSLFSNNNEVTMKRYGICWGTATCSVLRADWMTSEIMSTTLRI